MTDNDPRRRLMRAGALLPVAALMTARTLTRLELIDIPPLTHRYVYAALLAAGFIVWLAGELALRRT